MKRIKVSSTGILAAAFILGLAVMLYPAVSNWWNQRVQTRAVAVYDRTVGEIDNSEKEAALAAAEDYNRRLYALESPFTDYGRLGGYEDLLNIGGTGIMGYISIPKIRVELPIYHGTDEGVLNIAVGHFQGSSLPVGGENTNAVISAHRGLPSAKLFTDLNLLNEGDTFTITILDRVLTYEVDKIMIVLPTEMDKLRIVPGGDNVTLMTCTPYGINTHRLLVRARRVETLYAHEVLVRSDALQLDSVSLIPFFTLPFLLLLLIKWRLESKLEERSRRTVRFLAEQRIYTDPPDDI